MNHDEAAVEAAEKDFFERRGFHPDAHTWKDAQYGLELRTFLAGVRWREENPKPKGMFKINASEEKLRELAKAEGDAEFEIRSPKPAGADLEERAKWDRLQAYAADVWSPGKRGGWVGRDWARTIEDWEAGALSEREAIKGKLRENFWKAAAKALGVPDANGWKTGHAIIDELLAEK